ncbi:hypothetical protein [Bradyrhizobium sp. 153]|uniref:hypothetical protein n=1 Tax=Bradyrhizobium sp. 153 TaxID=2782627 RepID=UPI001FF802FA|nr:hypothetical protein [Bradyrhizobium sp. 153]MCK1667874.1 hypothetical protein [Bradyrhizobium sp. 153]
MLYGTECPIRIMVAVTFHFRETRLQYLFQVVRALCEYPVDLLDIFIVTNIDRDESLKQITNLCAPLFKPFPVRSKSKKSLLIESYPKLANPWLLPWSHKHLISDRFLKAESTYTHFIYVEDDVLLSFDNFCYFIHYREMLKARRLIPSFQRIEYNDADNRLYLLDQIGITDLGSRNSVHLDGYTFVNLDYPFNAMFILDRELAMEYVETPSFDRERSKLVRPEWDVACRAAMGLCFEDPPDGFSARYVSPVDPNSLATPSWSWVYHLPNNYAKDRLKPFAKTRADQQFSSEGNVLNWRPASKVVEYLALIRGKKRTNGPEPSL